MLVYSAAESPRLHYVTDFLAREWFDCPVSVTTDPDIFVAHPGPKMRYGGARQTDNSFYVPAVSLLFETGLRPQAISVFRTGNLPMFFAGEGDLPFDLFAAIFFLLSRYEEWLPFKTDEYGRFPPAASVAFRNGFLQRPLIDEWLSFFQAGIQAVFPELKFRRRFFRLLPTYDIDMAWSYRGKGFLRNAGGLTSDLLKGDLAAVRQRRAVLSGTAADPFDSFAWLDELHQKNNLQPHYFFLLAGKPGRLDKNISPANSEMRQLVKTVVGQYNTGIHPSWQSGDDAALLGQEMASLSELSGAPVTSSRQHYLRLTMPVTFRRLLQAGIRQDFSMGYGAVNGFRASFTGDFFWYDLAEERETALLLTPFCFMDATAYYGKDMNAAAALDEMRNLAVTIAGVDGRMVTLWHNHLLGPAAPFSDWRAAYGQFVGEIALELADGRRQTATGKEK